MKKLLFLIIGLHLFALSVINYNHRMDINKINFSNHVVVLPSDFMKYVFEHKNIRILGIKGRERGVIITHKKKLKEIKTIANANLAANIVLKTINTDYKEVKATLKDFLNYKVDAIYLNKDTFKKDKNLYIFHINGFIFFPKYIVVSDVSYIKKHIKELLEFKSHSDILFNGLVLAKYYYNDKTPFDHIIYFKNPKSKLYKIYVTPNWPPFDIYANGKLKGIGIDFWKLIAKKAHIDYIFVKDKNWNDILEKIKNKQADATPNTSSTPEREKFALFSKPYISFPLGVVCREDDSFESIKDIKSIAVGRNFTAEKLMKKHYPFINYIETKNTFDALKAVLSEKAECAVDILPVLLWYINKHRIHSLTLEFKTPFTFDLKVMINKNDKMLLNKINYAIDQITRNEKKNIVAKYSSVIIVEKNIHSLNKWVVAVFVVIIALILYILFKFKEKSEIDEMTNALNRTATQEELKDIIRKTDGSLLFLDLDRFKKINDTYGHEEGDRVLREFSKIVRHNIRSNDIFGRWGGEEFIIVLPRTKYEDAVNIAHKIRKHVEEHDFNGKKVTVSIGVTDFQRGESPETVVNRADEAVYEAKRNGRNQVVGKKDYI